MLYENKKTAQKDTYLFNAAGCLKETLGFASPSHGGFAF